jgi:hypothetical protein
MPNPIFEKSLRFEQVFDHLPATLESIAALCGVSRQLAQKSMSKLRSEGMVSYEYRNRAFGVWKALKTPNNCIGTRRDKERNVALDALGAISWVGRVPTMHYGAMRTLEIDEMLDVIDNRRSMQDQSFDLTRLRVEGERGLSTLLAHIF